MIQEIHTSENPLQYTLTVMLAHHLGVLLELWKSFTLRTRRKENNYTQLQTVTSDNEIAFAVLREIVCKLVLSLASTRHTN